MNPRGIVREELESAGRSVEAMRRAASVLDLESHWKNFLQSLERMWRKLIAAYKAESRWHSWSGKYSTQRKTDPLLIYLHHARNSNEHLLEPITRRVPTRISVPLPSNGRPISTLRFIVEGGKAQVESSEPVAVDFQPGRIELADVKDCGIDYKVPTSHLGKSIDQSNLIEVAELGFGFYSRVLDEAEAYFK